MKKINYIILALIIVILSVTSCTHIDTIVQAGAITLGAFTGIQVDQKIVDAISKSGVAFSKAFEEITPEQEYYIGRSVAANILASYRLQTNKPAMLAYLNKICNTLVINSIRPDIFNGYHVNILDSDEINAFATPGGHIFLTRGLIECTTSEDTLAAIIAHEIAHIQLQHGLKAIKNSRITRAIIDTGTSAVGVAASVINLSEMVDIFGDSVSEVVSTLVTNGYSRAQELDADSFAMSLLSLAGYEPSSLIDMLRVLEKEQSSHPGGFNRTHPTPAQRITNAQRTVGKYSIPDTRSYRLARFAAVR